MERLGDLILRLTPQVFLKRNNIIYDDNNKYICVLFNLFIIIMFVYIGHSSRTASKLRAQRIRCYCCAAEINDRPRCECQIYWVRCFVIDNTIMNDLPYLLLSIFTLLADKESVSKHF